jgi:glycogen debranching enzyme
MASPGMFGTALPRPGNVWEINAANHRLAFIPLRGRLAVDAPWQGHGCTRIVAEFLPENPATPMECAIQEYRQVRPAVAPALEYEFDRCVADVDREWNEWLAAAPAVPGSLAAARETAALVNWTSTVNPSGHLKYEAMFMSKNWMTSIWSWDHAFNAMALARQNPELAWDQLRVIFEHQDETGAFPDLVNDRDIVWNFVKPPIHGWALRWMLDRIPAPAPAELQVLYERIQRCTDWWFQYRDDDRDGLPQYNHGNDSGWDNSTVFASGLPVESPDLAAFLVLQMDALALLARRLGRESDAAGWTSRADATLAAMLRHFWRGDRFVAVRGPDHRDIESESLLTYIPLVLGKRLPPEVFRKLVAGLLEKDRFLTEYGLASESLSSPRYEADGYWRGPIWAPPMLLIVDGLVGGGEAELARDLAGRYCRLFARSGAAENFNARTGEGLRDLAYTWTASVFLVLAGDYL